MNVRKLRTLAELACACGARVEHGGIRCRKCRARARWRRRHGGPHLPIPWN
ncbi:hypothetical protein [Actinomadura parmotrematis]|uniref:Uncharacterized protein n=1 Tax=Actinomadura parmotrematis TaxID=2864039 RepID=A0ABS7FPM5_9ACTN|nr:hypothetical protein [Actinomadura parmotrematis]MBW8482261.1 hypothetical protein [Actinomadura parmotrematis]